MCKQFGFVAHRLHTPQVLYYALLPPIIFAAGFNLNIPAFIASIVPTMLLRLPGDGHAGSQPPLSVRGDADAQLLRV